MAKKEELGEVEALKAQLAEAQAKLAEKEEAEKSLPKPNGIKMLKAVAEMENKHDFPKEGSDGKGNLVKFVPKELVKDLVDKGWKKA